MDLLNKETIESIYEQATDILATIGVEFDLVDRTFKPPPTFYHRFERSFCHIENRIRV